MVQADTIVVGGGIGGLSALWHLCRAARAAGKPAEGIVLLERETLCGSAASGRNAGIFRHVEDSDASSHLALRTRALLDDLCAERSLLRETGAIYLAEEDGRVDALMTRAEATGVAVMALRASAPPESLRVAAGLIEGGRSRHASFVPGDGVLDVHGVIEAVRREALAHGGRILNRTSVARIDTAGGRVMGVVLEDGRRIGCQRLVLAAGAWAAELGATAGAPLPIEATRRHLAFLQAGQAPPPDGPILWQLGTEVYARPESGGFLTSPGDEAPWPPELAPPADRKVLHDLAVRLSASMPGVVESVVKRLWACLRTFAPDRRPVVGADPRVAGLYWLAGLGGQGLSTGLAAGEVLAAAMSGEGHPLAEPLSPARLLTAPAAARTGP
jgi:D-arginine dehydrogenase